MNFVLVVVRQTRYIDVKSVRRGGPFGASSACSRGIASRRYT